MIAWLQGRKDCRWWGWWFVYPLHNIRRVWRNHTGYYDV